MTRLFPVLVVLLAVFAVAPLEYPGAFQSYSGLVAVYNLIQLDRNPLQFISWAPTFGHAFDLFRSEGALPYLAAELLHRVGLGYLDAIKAVYVLAWIASGLAMFALARRFFSPAAALLAATVYVYLPYHIATVYVRGAFAEAVAWAIFPLALLALLREPSTEPSKPQSILWYLKRAVPFALLFLIQPGIAVLFALVAAGVLVALEWKTRDFVRPISAAVLGLVLGGLLDAPTVLHYGLSIARDGFSPEFVLPYQLFAPSWNWGVNTAELVQKGIVVAPLPLQLGVVPTVLAIAAMALAWRASAGSRRLLSVLAGAAVIAAFLTLEIAAPFWQVFGALASFPWQLLAFSGLALSLMAGAVMDTDERLAQPAMVAFFVALPVMASYSFLSPDWLDLSPKRAEITTFNNNEVALLDYRIVGPLRHGATLRVQMQWQALRQIDHDYTIFVHAVDAAGNTWGREDSKPQDGALPMTQWKPGQVVFDTHTIQIDVDGPREGYHLEVGLYQAANGQRALLASGADQLILPRPGDPPPTVSDQMPDATDDQAY